MYDHVLKADNSQVVLDPRQLRDVIRKYFAN
jgi:hypothetical protein